MAIYRVYTGKSKIKRVIKDILSPKKTQPYLCYFKNVNPTTVIEEMESSSLIFSRTPLKRRYFHFVIALRKDTTVTPKDLYCIAKRFVDESKYFVGYEVAVAIHTTQSTLHAHIVVNIVPCMWGKRKFQFSKRDLETFKQTVPKIAEFFRIQI